MKQKVLYFYPNEASYVNKDLAIIGKKYEIIKYRVEPSQVALLPIRMLYQLYLCIRYFRIKYIICQFAGYHSFIPMLIGKLSPAKTVVVLGGSDCASFPEIDYGNYRKPVLGLFTTKSIQLADIISPVHEKMIHADYHYENFKRQTQGFKAFTGEVKGRIEVIYNGFVTDKFKDLKLERNTGFVCIAAYNRPTVFYLKGIDLLTKAAEHFPEIPFTIIGVDAAFMSQKRPQNLTYLPFMPQEDLVEVLNKHRFYCQLSISEGFPNALGEAMLCGCVPLVSEVGSMPAIIGDTGFVLSKYDENLLFEKITEMLAAPNLTQLSENARNRILQNFTIQQREDALLALLS